MTVPGAIDVIAHLTQTAGHLVGAGTVLDAETAAPLPGCRRGVSDEPWARSGIVEFAVKRDVVVLPGALTPSEVMAAWKAGADFVKVFPCAQWAVPTTSGR